MPVPRNASAEADPTKCACNQNAVAMAAPVGHAVYWSAAPATRARERAPSLMPATLQRISVIDSHTGGEPTRVVVAGGPDLGPETVAERLNVFRDRHDRFRS